MEVRGSIRYMIVTDLVSIFAPALRRQPVRLARQVMCLLL